jgi:trehalose 2-sulfotransferase
MKGSSLFPFVERSYTLAFAPRSGSNEICNLLTRNGLGCPSELFQTLLHPTRGVASDDLGTTDHLISIIKSHTINGVFGSKMAHDHRGRIEGVLSRTISNYRNLDDFLPNHRWIWLRRCDKIAQAVSLSRAEQSGAWMSGIRCNNPGVIFDYHHVLSRLMILCVCDAAWEAYFKANDIKPYVVYYETFFSDVPRSLSGLVRHLGGRPCELDPEVDATTTLMIQRDAMSSEWAARFQYYLNKVGDIGMGRELGRAHKRWEEFFFGYGWRDGDHVGSS